MDIKYIQLFMDYKHLFYKKKKSSMLYSEELALY